jgi:hypothetical protein
MTRRPVGTRRQPLSDTALFAHVASRLEHVSVRRLDDWLAELGLAVGADAVRRAPGTAARLAGAFDPGAAIRPWALVDYAALDLFLAAITLRFAGSRSHVLAGLERVDGVVDVLGVHARNEALLIAVFERRHDRTALEQRLGEFGDVLDWRDIDEHRPTAAITTFRSLAQTAGRAERLSAPSST